MNKLKNSFTVWQWAWVSWAAVLCLGQLQRWQITTTAAVYAHDLMILGWLVVWLFSERSEWRSWWRFLKEKIGRVEGLVVMSVLMGWMGATSTGQNLLQPLLYASRFGVYTLFAWGVWKKQAVPGVRSQAWRGVLGMGLLMTFLGWLQYLLLPDLRFLAALGWDDHYYRLVGTLLDPSFMALWLVLAFWYAQRGINQPRWRWLVAGLFLITLAFTYSRSAYLAWFSSVFAALLVPQLRSRWRELAVGAVVLGFIILNLPKPGGEGTRLGRTTSVVARQNVIKDSLSSFTTSQWLIGKGWFVPVKPPYTPLSQAQQLVPDHGQQADNILLAVLGYGGLIGTISLFFLLKKHAGGLVLKDLAPLWTAVLVHGLFNNSLFQPFVLLYLLMGLVSYHLVEKR